jgi:hypothetical protein
MNMYRTALGALVIIAAVPAVNAQTVNVDTSASVTASYGPAIQTVGPFPWSDLGVNATASIAPGDLNLATGGATAFALATTLTPGETIPNGTTFNVGYTPGWAGTFSAAAASGNINSNFVYNIGPLSGSDNILNANVVGGGSPSANLASALNAGTGQTVSAFANGSGPGASVGYTLSAQACVIECVTLASASVDLNVGTQVQHSVSVTPTVTYGDLVWVSTTPGYSTSAPQAFIAGSGGSVANPLGNVSGLGLSNGQRFYYNILPEVELSMPISSAAELALPASITASFNVLGVGGSKSFPLGNLYSLDTGSQTFDFDATFHNNDYYSIPLDYVSCNNNSLVGACSDAVVASSYVGQLGTLGNGDVPTTGTCGTASDCSVTLPGGPGIVGGYGTGNLGPLIPGDPSNGNVCAGPGTPYGGQCINKVILNRTMAPEMDSNSAAASLTLLFGALAVLRGRRRLGLASGASANCPTQLRVN